jgi:hypothetical protein
VVEELITGSVKDLEDRAKELRREWLMKQDAERKDTLPEPEVSAYDKYVRDICDSYEEQPLGQTSNQLYERYLIEKDRIVMYQQKPTRDIQKYECLRNSVRCH